MDLFSLIFLSLVSFLIGVIITLVVQYYILYIYFKKSPIVRPLPTHNSVCYSLPESLKKQLENEDLKQGSSSLPINVVLQFLFHELRHSESIKRWLYKKLSLEFEELLTKTTIGKFFDSINIKDMHLGDQFPDIKDITIEDVKLDKKEGYIDTVNVSINLDYTGNFLLSVDAKMKFGRTAYLSIKVKRICGLARLQFTRQPYTHWSFSFYNDPILDLAVESHFQGRQLQSNITNLIVNQIKKAIKRKHTLPNYKIRYKPFFIKTDPSQLDSEDGEIIPQGQLEISCTEVTRLEIPSNIQNVYCTICIDSIAWISLYQIDEKTHMTLEVTLTKLRQNQLGVVFRQEQNQVIVDNVTPHTSAYKSGLKNGDIVLSVENKTVNTVAQVAKLIKSISHANITLRIERFVDFYSFKYKYKTDINKYEKAINDKTPLDDEQDLQQQQIDDSFVIVDKIDSSTGVNFVNKRKNILKTPTSNKIIPTNEMSKLAQTIGNFSLRKRKTSIDNTKNTLTSSNPGTPQHHLKTLPKKHSLGEVPEIRTEDECETIDVIRGKELGVNSMLVFNEDFQFNLKENHKYLNINVWGTNMDEEKDVLLGYTNIPLSHILNECCNSVLGHYIRSYSFLPPIQTQGNTQNHPLMSHSGFEQVFCYGDILLSCIWNHDDDIELKRKMSTVVLEPELKPTLGGKHDFIRTQFHRTTHCDFCSKKIWLKDAVQCRECGLCCHKKCIAKCQISTACVSTITTRTDADNQEIMNETGDEQPLDVVKIASDLKRVNSANSLAIPGAHSGIGISKSLPPSPQRTPSRKQSLSLINPFGMCPTVLEDILKTPQDAPELINKLLEQIMLCPNDESLMDSAKETGRQLYVNIPHEERVEKINRMMTELKKTLDAVTLEHMELSKQMSCEESEVEKTKLAFLMGQADAKVHGLSVLMLHYCSSLQHTQEKIV